MDPLSLTASILAVVGATSATAQALEKLRSLRHAPQQILVVVHEVSDFRTVIVTLQAITQDLSHQKTDPKIIEHIGHLIEKAQNILEKINSMLTNGLVKNLHHLGTEGIKISWRIWLRRQGRMFALVAHLADIKKEITTTLTVLIAAEVPRVQIDLQSIAFNNREISTSMQTLENSTKTRLESMAEEVSTIQPSLDTLQTVLQQLQLAGQESQTIAAPPYRETEKNSPRSPTTPTFRIQSSLRRSCTDLCVCHCHKPTNINSPQHLWMKTLLGSLFIAYSGVPFSKRRPCTETACLKEHQALLKVSYFFPSWFLGDRMLVLRDRFSPLDGHSISVRTPKIVDGNDPAVWAAIHGLGSLRDLFVYGTASPLDLDELGQSLIRIALSCRKLDVCKILLQSYSDPNHEDTTERLKYSIDILWQLSLRDPSNVTLNHDLQRLFSHYLDPKENYRNRRFSTLHQIILGLSPLDLEEHLQTSVESINAECSMGRTALSWAARRSDISAVRTLFAYGARITNFDQKGQTPIHHATQAAGDSVEIMEMLLSAATITIEEPSYGVSEKFHDSSENPVSDEGSEFSEDTFEDDSDGMGDEVLRSLDPSIFSLVNHSDNHGWTPLHYSALDNKYARAIFLISRGAEVDPPNSPLLLSIQFNGHSVLALLLSHGANLHAVDDQKQGILHYAAAFGDFETLNILKALRFRDIEMRDGRGETPLQVWEKWRAELIDENELEREKCWAVFESMLAYGENIKGKGPDICRRERKDEDDIYESETGDEDNADQFYDAESDIERIHCGYKT